MRTDGERSMFVAGSAFSSRSRADDSVAPMLSPEIIALLIGGATLLFGAERIPKLARSVGQARKEFLSGQAEADRIVSTK
jgi:hypothetical protein